MRFVARHLAVLAISIAGCVPARDNLHDPSNQPRVRAEIIDHTLADGRCAGDFSLEWPVVAAASRGRCLAVDARETTEPQGESVEKLDFSLALDGAPIDVVTSAGVLVIASAALASLATDVVLELEVTAEDDSGANGSARVSLVLLNPRPVAVARPGRTLPTLGWPWSPPDGERVLFDATGSFDPDGIPLPPIAGRSATHRRFAGGPATIRISSERSRTRSPHGSSWSTTPSRSWVSRTPCSSQGTPVSSETRPAGTRS